MSGFHTHKSEPSELAVKACLREVRAIRDDDDFPMAIRMEAAKWSAFIDNGFYPEKPLFLPDELLARSNVEHSDKLIRHWSARRSDLVVNQGMDTELLEATKDQLIDMVACIMQTDAAQAATFTGRLGRSITAHLTGAGASAGLLGLAAAVGTASTGTAIGTLSGAALVSSQLAWIGSFVGGGMAAGSIITGGLGLVVGVIAMILLGKLRIKPRQYDELPQLDRQLVDKCSWTIAAINEDLDSGKVSPWAAQEKVYREHLISLYDMLVEKKDFITSNLKAEYATRLSNRIIPDFKSKVLDKYEAHFEQVNLPHLLYTEGTAMVAITSVLWNLWKQDYSFDTPEEKLVIEALKRSNSDLSDATLSELSSYVGGMSGDQLKGLANNVKGIYHELRYVEQFNEENPNVIAELHPATNSPGSDIVIRDLETGEIVNEIQLKATDSSAYILEHFEKYPDIPLVSTKEVAEAMEDIQSSGLSNIDLEQDVSRVNQELSEFGPFSDAISSAEMGGILGLAIYGLESNRGKKTATQAGRRALEGAGVAAGTSVVIGYLFG
jgi:hypothetical protein